jgi:DNA-binding MarR family transcriptional regulator
MTALTPHFEREEALGELENCSETSLLARFVERMESFGGSMRFSRPVEDESARKVAYLIARLSQFARIYLKNALADTEVQSPEEFGFLMALSPGRSASKSDLIREQLIEIPTGMDMLRRMQKRGLIAESSTQPDRRSKWIELTDLGARVAEKCTEKIAPVAQIISADLDETELLSLKNTLERLDRYHSGLSHHSSWPQIRLLLESEKNPSAKTSLRKA